MGAAVRVRSDDTMKLACIDFYVCAALLACSRYLSDCLSPKVIPSWHLNSLHGWRRRNNERGADNQAGVSGKRLPFLFFIKKRGTEPEQAPE